MYSPSEFPQPAKSKVNKVTSWHKIWGIQDRLFIKKIYTLQFDSYCCHANKSHKVVTYMDVYKVDNDCILSLNLAYLSIKYQFVISYFHPISLI